VTSLNNNDFVITWHFLSSLKIYTKIFHIEKSLHSILVSNEDFLVANSSNNNYQRRPVVTNITADTFAISWDDEGYDGSGYTIMARVFYNNGTPLAVEFQVNTYNDSTQWYSSIASFDNQNYFVICWTSYGQDGSGFGMFAQLYDSHSINTIGDQFQINTYTDNDQRNYNRDAIATITSSNAFVVAWYSNNQDGDGNGVYAQRFFLDDHQTS
jgi:hypothetical protein